MNVIFSYNKKIGTCLQYSQSSDVAVLNAIRLKYQPTSHIKNSTPFRE